MSKIQDHFIAKFFKIYNTDMSKQQNRIIKEYQPIVKYLAEKSNH